MAMTPDFPFCLKYRTHSINDQLAIALHLLLLAVRNSRSSNTARIQDLGDMKVICSSVNTTGGELRQIRANNAILRILT